MAITHRDLLYMLVDARTAVTDEFALQTMDMFPVMYGNRVYTVGVR